MDTWRCVLCGCPSCDHVKLRYFWKPWMAHTFGRLLGKIEDTNPDV